MNYFLLSAVGPDRPGIVANVTAQLFKANCNLEDCSMMRLGSEFAMLILFTARSSSEPEMSKHFERFEDRYELRISIKKISRTLAQFKPLRKGAVIIRVQGYDRPGIVYQVTDLLATYKFNITDLASHRTSGKSSAGYVVLIEGEPVSETSRKKLSAALMRVAKKLKVKISIESIDASPL